MKAKINTYAAALLVTIAGGAAAVIIVHIATTDVVTVVAQSTHGTEASYADLRQALLKRR